MISQLTWIKNDGRLIDKILKNYYKKRGEVLARPKKWRKIEKIPSVFRFIPSKSDRENIPENILNFEELEAIRLKDLEGLEQELCAEKMEVSRPTFQRILLSARGKIADSLVNGKTIHIEGGNFTQNICSVRCLDCSKKWMDRLENLETIKNEDYICPFCGSVRIVCGQTCGGKFFHRNCCKRRNNAEEWVVPK